MRRRRWTGPEIQMLRDRYPDEGPFQLALELSRSEDSVSSFARRCGLRTERRQYGNHDACPHPEHEKVSES